MKYLLLLFFTCLCTFLNAQTTDWGDKAFAAYERGDYLAAAAACEQFFPDEPRSNMITRLAVRAYAQAGDTTHAIMHLQRYMYIQRSFGFTEFADDLLQDTALANIHGHEYFTDIIAEVRGWEKELAAKEKREVVRLDSLQKALEENYDAFESISQARIKKPEDLEEYLSAIEYKKLPLLDGKRLHLYLTYRDTIRVPFVVILPDNYDPVKSYPAVVGLHGGIWGIEKFDSKAGDGGANYGLTMDFEKMAEERGLIRIFIEGNKYYNWIYPADGFDITPEILAYTKRFVNLDDNRISVIGHSNGASGAFNYLVRKPSSFAGFYGLNTRPYNFTGGTFLQNAVNRSFYNLSSDQDYYYPGSAAKTIDSLAQRLNVDWTDEFFPGTPHWWLYSGGAAPTISRMLDDAMIRHRNPYANEITWFADTLSEGRCDWINITAFRPSESVKSWADTINFITKDWVSVDEPTERIDRVGMAFKFPRSYGAVHASCIGNVFRIETSQVQSFSLSISKDMVDFKRPVKIFVNGELVNDMKVKFDRNFALNQLKSTKDRKALWLAEIQVVVPE